MILTKALGVGIYSAAFKKGELGRVGYEELIATTTLLNRVGGKLGADASVHAMTDVTGFGLLGHALEMAKGSGKRLTIDAACVPVLSEAAALAKKGFVTGASHRNWESFKKSVILPDETPDWQRHLYCDPQTSGGLLVSCASDTAHSLVETIVADGYPAARIIGRVEDEQPGGFVEIRA